jgi:hypothetical protein
MNRDLFDRAKDQVASSGGYVSWISLKSFIVFSETPIKKLEEAYEKILGVYTALLVEKCKQDLTRVPDNRVTVSCGDSGEVTLYGVPFEDQHQILMYIENAAYWNQEFFKGRMHHNNEGLIPGTEYTFILPANLSIVNGENGPLFRIKTFEKS